jgi:radical SAM family uncharacterized protein/radical SAM-linked protein
MADRIFTPAPDYEKRLKETGLSLAALESRRPLRDFDIIGFSLLYELNYTNILTILDLAGIPFRASERNESMPLIIAGGPCTCNPEPVADFFDAIVIGDGEEVILKISEAWIELKKTGASRQDILKKWSEIEGLYIPSFFRAEFTPEGFQKTIPLYDNYKTVKRTVIPDLENAPFPDSPVVPLGRPIHDRLRLEIARGCSRGCRFCQAGMIYRPVRERSLDKLFEITEKSLASTGYDDLSLLSLSTGDYSCLADLMTGLMKKYASDRIAVSFPSIRAGMLNQQLMEEIKKVRKTGFTIAPEAGTQRLRDVINKNLTEDEISDTVKSAFDLGWLVIKLYFMIGLPTETDEDIEGITALAERLRQLKKGRARQDFINVSITTFIPKPNVPFQWESQITTEEALDKIYRLRAAIHKIPGVGMKWQDPRLSLLEGVFARGDRRLSEVIVTAWQKGCRLDGWSDHFRLDLWNEALAENEIDPAFFTTRKRSMDEPLPWDHINSGISRDFLESELKKAFSAELTHDCRNGDCTGCGICDFESIMPRTFRTSSGNVSDITDMSENSDRTDIPAPDDRINYRKIRVDYSKSDDARFIGHIEMVNNISRALRRAKLPIRYSEGFHPIPKLSFNDPLSIGTESLCEHFFLYLPDDYDLSDTASSINRGLPDGLRILKVSAAPEKEKINGFEETYRLKTSEPVFSEDTATSFMNSESFPFHKVSKKGKVREMDLRPLVLDMNILSPNEVEITLKWIQGESVRAFDAVCAIFGIEESGQHDFRLVKTIVKPF